MIFKQHPMELSRRRWLALGASAAFSAFIPRPAGAGSRDPRFVVIVLRGGMDGLAVVPPVGDPDYATLRGSLLDTTTEVKRLDGFFGLHPAMSEFHQHYQDGEALVVHASASPYRERSHFDGQDVLETGLPGIGRRDSGWLNRALLIHGGRSRTSRGKDGLTIGITTPLIMRGDAQCLAWAPMSLTLDDHTLPERVLALYRHSDPQLARVYDVALHTKALASDLKAGRNLQASPGNPDVMEAMAMGAAKLMARDDGPRIAALAFEGWDTHNNEMTTLTRQLGGLDRALAALKSGLGPGWKDTAILVMTEFGRTAAVNGTGGTDHGTATTVLLAGGAIKGGRVVADWPGLKSADLYQSRDLMPTADVRGVAKGVMQGLFDMPISAMASRIFPESSAVKPIRGLIA